MALPYPIPDPATGDWNPFALKRNLEYLDGKIPPPNTTGPGVYYHSGNSRGTVNDTNETVAFSVGVVANTVSAASDAFHVVTRFVTAANGNTKRVRVYLGASVIADTGAVVMNNQVGMIEAWIYSGNFPTLQNNFSEITWSTNATAGTPTRMAAATQTTEDFRTGIAIAVTMQNGSPTAEDVRVYSLLIEKIPGRA